MDEQNTNQTSPQQQAQPLAGVPSNVACALTYSLGFITGIIFYMISPDKTVKFHALQSIFTFLGLFVVSIVVGFIPGLGLLLSPLVTLASIALWVLLMVKAYKGEKFKLPVVGDLAEQHAK